MSYIDNANDEALIVNKTHKNKNKIPHDDALHMNEEC